MLPKNVRDRVSDADDIFVATLISGRVASEVRSAGEVLDGESRTPILPRTCRRSNVCESLSRSPILARRSFNTQTDVVKLVPADASFVHNMVRDEVGVAEHGVAADQRIDLRRTRDLRVGLERIEVHIATKQAALLVDRPVPTHGVLVIVIRKGLSRLIVSSAKDRCGIRSHNRIRGIQRQGGCAGHSKAGRAGLAVPETTGAARSRKSLAAGCVPGTVEFVLGREQSGQQQAFL